MNRDRGLECLPFKVSVKEVRQGEFVPECAFIHRNAAGESLTAAPRRADEGLTPAPVTRSPKPYLPCVLQFLGVEEEGQQDVLTAQKVDSSHPMPALLHIELADGKGNTFYWFGGKNEEYGADSY
jgi:hypothetical protein